MKVLLVCFLLCFSLFSGFPETIYVYTFEICNEEPVPAEFQVKEGILDGLFEAGHIVFDDVSDSIRENLLTEDNIDGLLLNVKKGGAYYLVGAYVLSKINTDDTIQHIESIAFYYLYDVSSGKLIHKGNKKIDNSEANAKVSKENLWFQLGLYISEEVSRFYNSVSYSKVNEKYRHYSAS